MGLMTGMKQPDPAPRPRAPGPRLTLWVPALLSAVLCALWLGLLALARL